MESLFKLIANFFLRLEQLLRKSSRLISQGIRLQQAQLFVTIILVSLTILFLFSWQNASIWVRFLFAFIYLLVFLFCTTVIYFFIAQENESIEKNKEEASFDLKLYKEINSIVVGVDQIQRVFVLFSESYFEGDYKSFESLLLLKYLKEKPPIVWVDQNPNNPTKINRQTLLEFLSQVFFGFENLTNLKIVEFANYYFTIKDHKGKLLRISTKNVSDWRNNRSPYLQRISVLLSQTIKR